MGHDMRHHGRNNQVDTWRCLEGGYTSTWQWNNWKNHGNPLHLGVAG